MLSAACQPFYALLCWYNHWWALVNSWVTEYYINNMYHAYLHVELQHLHFLKMNDNV